MTILRRLYLYLVPERDLIPNSRTNALRAILERKTWHSFEIKPPAGYRQHCSDVDLILLLSQEGKRV